ncbi:Fis family transcriptional regulator [Rhodococcus fascians]|nr:Fis family transcriptional regulator [Rhodococcus fascians]MBY4237934.1 Fis family transcriptional regulator [Rhodococcus fascians]MBY4253315.1 Fis family transcriptional regulator [Rhodococcus fascians]MBY4268952.1 Fis family transcriptional regulator [Rhodococcus fascians]
MDARLVSVATRMMNSRLQNLHRAEACLFLTNSAGVILHQWSGNSSLMSQLAKLDVEPGFLVSETTLGTTSGSTLITRAPTFVRGPEHFGDQFFDFTSAGSVITHPVLRKVVGSINLLCRFRDTSPMAVSWVCEIVADIERELRDASTKSEQLLMQNFLLENRDSRHPVVAVSEQTVVTNAAAARMLGSVDQVLLWEFASKIVADPHVSGEPLILGDGMAVDVRCRSIMDEQSVAGVVMNLKRTQGASTPARTTPMVPGLVGSGPRWVTMCERVFRADKSSLLLVGEPGVGKTAVACALAGPDALVVDSCDASTDDEWMDTLSWAVQTRDRAIIVEHIDALPSHLIASVAALISRHHHEVRFIATTAAWPHDGHPSDDVLSRFVSPVLVPSLRERMEDLPGLVTHFTARYNRSGRTVRWMSDALQALSRIEWTDNVAGLERLVARMVTNSEFEYIGARDLPAQLAGQTSRRTLGGLERVEATAIIDALRDAGGNKHQAAASLGIARSTLYRKMRTLGIDLEESTF